MGIVGQFDNKSEEIFRRAISTFMRLDSEDPGYLFDEANLREVVNRIREVISVQLYKDAVIRMISNSCYKLFI